MSVTTTPNTNSRECKSCKVQLQGRGPAPPRPGDPCVLFVQQRERSRLGSRPSRHGGVRVRSEDSLSARAPGSPRLSIATAYSPWPCCTPLIATDGPQLIFGTQVGGTGP